MSDTQKQITEENEKSILYPYQQQNVQKNQQDVDVSVKTKAQNLIGMITHQIQGKIQNSQVVIANQTIPFEIEIFHKQGPLENSSQKFDQKKIAQFIRKRKSLQQQIVRLNFKQQQQKQKLRSRSSHENSHNKAFRSHYTQQQHMEISRIKKQSEEFQHKIVLKQQQLYKKIQEQRKKEVQQHNKQIKKQKQNKKQESLKKIQQIHQQQKQRLQKLRQQNKKVQLIKNERTLHQKIQQYQKQLQHLKRIKQKQVMKDKRKSMMYDVEQFRRHQKNYYESVKQERQRLRVQMAQKAKEMKLKQNQINQAYRPSKFLKTLFNQEKRRQQQDRQKIQQVRSLFSRKNTYQQELRDRHKQLIRPKPKHPQQRSITQIKSQQRRLKAKSLNAADIYRQGQQYMKSVHSNIGYFHIQQSRVQLQNNYKALKQGSRTQYKDYLQESKVKRQTYSKSTGQLNVNPQLRQLKTIILNKDKNATDNLFKAKLISKKLDEKAKNSSTRNMVNSIAAKLKIIEQFT